MAQFGIIDTFNQPFYLFNVICYFVGCRKDGYPIFIKDMCKHSWSIRTQVFIHIDDSLNLASDVLKSPFICVHFRENYDCRVKDSFKILFEDFGQHFRSFGEDSASLGNESAYLANQDYFNLFPPGENSWVGESIDYLLFRAACIEPPNQISRGCSIVAGDVWDPRAWDIVVSYLNTSQLIRVFSLGDFE